MESYKGKLKKLCLEVAEDFLSRSENARNMLKLSLEEGITHPADVQRALRNYEELVRLKTLWELYHQWFPNEVTEEALPQVTQRLEKKRGQISDYLTRNI